MEAIKLVKEEKYKESYELLCNTTVLQSICGRVCPHEKQCQGKCIRGIKGNPTSIGEMEAYVGKIALEENYPFDEVDMPKKKEKVAIIGGGPAGLTCTAFLARKGYQVTIFDYIQIS